jgi:hypothetical protein
MDEFSRPATLDDLKSLLRSLNEHRVDYLLIGGYALAGHGYHRATTDIGVVVPATAEAGQRVKDALMIERALAFARVQPDEPTSRDGDQTTP